MSPATEFAIWMGILAVVLVVAAYAIWHLRKRLFGEDEEEEEVDNAPLYTTAEIERLKSEGLIDDKQYRKLKAETREAAKRRAERAKRRDKAKRGIFD